MASADSARALDPLRGIPGVFVHGSNDHAAPSPRNPLRYFTGPRRCSVTSEPLDTQALDGYLTDELGWLDLNNAVGSLDVPVSASTRSASATRTADGTISMSLPDLLDELAGRRRTRRGDARASRTRRTAGCSTRSSTSAPT